MKWRCAAGAMLSAFALPVDERSQVLLVVVGAGLIAEHFSTKISNEY